MNSLLELEETIRLMTGLTARIADIARQVSACVKRGGQVLWMGNGGSAAQCQHFAAELVGRFTRERRGLPSIALTTDSSILTAVANDYSFGTVFARQVQALCRRGDVAVGLSTSGNSENVLQGIRAARAAGAYTVGLSGGDGGGLRNAADVCLVVPSCSTARIQEGHLFIGHILCDWIEARMAGDVADA